MTSFAGPFLCLYCERFAGTQIIGPADTVTCSAYPDGIPAAIVNNEADHRQPYPGDNGLRFRALSRRARERADALVIAPPTGRLGG